MMNKHTHPHMSLQSSILANLPHLLGFTKDTLQPGQGDLIATEFQRLQGLQASAAKQYATSNGADNRTRRMALEAALSGSTKQGSK